MKRLVVVSVIAAALVALPIAGYRLWDATTCYRFEFDPAEWKRARDQGLDKEWKRLYPTAQALVTCGTLEGIDERSARKLLGRPTSRQRSDNPGNRLWVYDLGLADQMLSDEDSLLFDVDRSGRVRSPEVEPPDRGLFEAAEAAEAAEPRARAPKKLTA